jgi:hypothetical protein
VFPNWNQPSYEPPEASKLGFTSRLAQAETGEPAATKAASNSGSQVRANESFILLTSSVYASVVSAGTRTLASGVVKTAWRDVPGEIAILSRLPAEDPPHPAGRCHSGKSRFP